MSLTPPPFIYINDSVLEKLEIGASQVAEAL